MSTINELRDTLFDTLRELRAGKIDLDRAEAINGTAQVIINSVKAETDYLRATGQTNGSGFIAPPAPALPQAGQPQTSKTATGSKTVAQLANGATVTRHRMDG